MPAYRLDSQGEERPALVGRDGGKWNGWAVPIVTAGELLAWIRELGRTDPNGTWDALYVVATPTHLELWDDFDGLQESWEWFLSPTLGARLGGWTWVEVSA